MPAAVCIQQSLIFLQYFWDLHIWLKLPSTVFKCLHIPQQPVLVLTDVQMATLSQLYPAPLMFIRGISRFYCQWFQDYPCYDYC